MLLTLTVLLLQLITLVKESVRFSWLLSGTEFVCKVPIEEATTDNVSVLLAPLVAVLATEVEEEAQEAMVMAVEAAEAVEAEGIIPAPIMCPSMESDLSDPFHSFTTDEWNKLGYNGCKQVFSMQDSAVCFWNRQRRSRKRQGRHSCGFGSSHSGH